MTTKLPSCNGLSGHPISEVNNTEGNGACKPLITGTTGGYTWQKLVISMGFVTVCIIAAFNIGILSFHNSFSYQPLAYLNTSGRATFTFSKWNNDCTSAECLMAATHIVNSLNTSVDPCTSFYEFACGRWPSHNPRPEGEERWDVTVKLYSETDDEFISILTEPLADQEPISLAKIYYNQCFETHKNSQHVRFKDMEFIWDHLEQYGGWPILYAKGTWNASRFNWMKSVVGLKKEFGSAELIELSVFQELNGNNSSNAIEIRNSHSGFSVLKEGKEIRDLVDVIAWELFKFGLKLDMLDSSDTYFRNSAQKTVEMSKAIIIANQEISIRNVDTYTVESLQRALDKATIGNKLHIKQLIDTFFAGTQIQVGKTQKIYVSDFQYLVKISHLVSWVEGEVLANYLHYHMVKQIMRHLSVGINYNYVTPMNDSKVREICLGKVTKLFPVALGHAYAQRKLSHGWENYNFPVIANVFENIISEYKNLVSNSQLSFVNKTLLIERLQVMRICLGYPSWITSKQIVQEEHRELRLFQNMSYIQQHMAVNQWILHKELKLIAKPRSTDICNWIGFPSNTMATYGSGIVHVPLAMMQFPSYGETLPRAWIYGSLGSIIGHEIAHGLVGIGWSEEMNGVFYTPVATCLIEQYGQYSFNNDTVKDMTVNGEVTLTENLCDNAGILAAYKAYKGNSQLDSSHKMDGLEKYTNDQLFYMGFAQIYCDASTMVEIRDNLVVGTHSPKQFRIFGTTQNSEEFATAWKCSAKKSKCALF